MNELSQWLKLYDDNFSQPAANYDGGFGMSGRAVSDRAAMLGHNGNAARMGFAERMGGGGMSRPKPSFFQDQPMEPLQFTQPERVGRDRINAGGMVPREQPNAVQNFLRELLIGRPGGSMHGGVRG